MKKYFCFFLCLFYLSVTAQKTDDSVRKALLIDTLNMVDWALNNDFFFLTTDKGIRASIGSIAYKKLSKEFENDIVLVNKGGTYLWVKVFLFGHLQSLYFSVTDNNGSIPAGRKFYSKVSSFVTNRGIFLGMTEDDFLKKSKDLPYQINSEKEGKSYQFESINLSSVFTNISFIYRAAYSFKKGKLIYYRFGFS